MEARKMQKVARALMLSAIAATGCAQPWANSGQRSMVLGPPPSPQAEAHVAQAGTQHSLQQSAVTTAAFRGQSPGDVGSMRDGYDSMLAPEKEPGTLKGMFRKATSFARPSESEEAARKLMKEGDELFLAKNYKEALARYEGAAKRVPDTYLEEDARFMMGECYFFLDDYPNASDTYSEILRRNSNTRHLDRITRRMFAIGEYWKERYQEAPTWALRPNLTDKTRPLFDTKGNSVSVFRAIWMHDPTGPLADDSIMQVANTHFLNGNYQEADEHYAQLRRDYPSSKHVMQAYLLGYRTKLELYQGPIYDRTPLNEAEELIDTLLLQFGNELGEERERVLQARAIVRAQQAERDWNNAEYYIKGGYNRAARKVLEKLISKYPETKFAEEARHRLAALEGQPDHPPDRMAWLANLFPKEKPLPQPINAKHRSEMR